MLQSHSGALIVVVILFFGISCLIYRKIIWGELIVLAVGVALVLNTGTILEALGIENVCRNVK